MHHLFSCCISGVKANRVFGVSKVGHTVQTKALQSLSQSDECLYVVFQELPSRGEGEGTRPRFGLSGGGSDPGNRTMI